jgi:hypothetical protein
MTGTARRAYKVEQLTESEAAAALGGVRSELFRVEGGDLKLPVLVQLGRAADRELVCTGIAIGFDATSMDRVPAEATRIPLQEIVVAVSRELPDGLLSGELRSAGAFARWGVFVRPRARPGAHGYDVAELREWKRRYIAALKANPRAPTKALALEQSMSDQAVRYALRKAEDKLGSFRTSKRRKQKRGGRQR